MENTDLEFGLKNVSSLGYTLNVKEVALLNASLAKLQAEEKCGRAFLWGKIFGSAANYFVAFGLRDSDVDFPTKQFYYATDKDYEFSDLPELDSAAVEKISTYQRDAPFSGNPGAALFAEDESEEAAGEKYTEAERLAYTISMLNHETSVVPRDAYTLNDSLQVVPSPDFKGLDYAHLGNLSNYVHFRPPTNAGKKRASVQSDAEWKNGNFLDTLSSALPQGSWVVRKDPAASSVQLRSLVWPGYTFFAVCGKSHFGSLYMGYGHRVDDLAFMLP